MQRKERCSRRDDLPLVAGSIRRGDRDLCTRLAAGNVLRGLRGVPRIGPEDTAMVFERYLDLAQPDAPVTVFDPCCGTGVILAVLQTVYADHIGTLHGADADAKAVRITKANVDILNDPTVMAARIEELIERRARTGSLRLDAVIEDAHALVQEPRDGRPPVHITNTNALFDPMPLASADLIFTDPPYDRRSRWIGATLDDEVGIRMFLERARDLISATGRIALVLDPAVALPTVPGLAIEARVALPKRAGWLLARVAATTG